MREDELRKRIMKALGRYLVLIPAVGTGCASVVRPTTDGSTDAPAADQGTSDTAQTDALDGITSPRCTNGARELRECMTLSEVENRIRNPPGEIPRDASVDAPITIPRDPNGCYVPSGVQSGCCNPATAVTREGERCCYLWCELGCCGRAFVVDGAIRVSAMRRGDEWCDAIDLTPPLGEPDRVAIARAWRDDGLFEHASIASFARFALDLLAHGAPPDLVRDAHAAAVDEVGHARLCFGIAAAIDGEALSPAALSMHGALASNSFDEIVRAAVIEGCVGETAASVVAAAQLEQATDPVVRESLTRIVRDEQRHSELAWRFVAWALRDGQPRLRNAVSEAFVRALNAPVGAPERPQTAGRAVWGEYGRLERSAYVAAVARAKSDVIVPCALAMLGQALRADSAAAAEHRA